MAASASVAAASRLTREAMSPDMRIGIVGAGVSGLTTAHELRNRGYRDVIVLERDAQVGGKCRTITVDDRSYELGAVFAAASFTNLHELARHVGLATMPMPRFHAYDPDGRRASLYGWPHVPSLLWQFAVRYSWYSRARYARIARPGLDRAPTDLCQDFATFADRHGIGSFAKAFAPVVTGFGYGYPEDVPAAYVMKYLDWATAVACARHRGCCWPDGIQTLWRRLAEEHEVELGVTIERVERGETITVATDRGRTDVDALVLACPLDGALAFLDVSTEEAQLFSRIRYVDYWVALCAIDGLPRDVGFVPAHLTASQQGHVMLWYRRWMDRNLYTLYLLGDAATDRATVEAGLAADLARLGGELKNVVTVRKWRYFPHVAPDDMAEGFYPRLEALQGVRRTFYTGEVMSFATMECCARYARSLVATRFPAAALTPAATSR
jgi:hypothetical protein